MSTHWWQPVPGEDAPRASQRIQAPPAEQPPADGAAHLQAHAFDGPGNTWGASTTDGADRLDLATQPANETQWPLPGPSRATTKPPLPVTFGDETTQAPAPGASRPAVLEVEGLHLARCLDLPGIEEAAVRFANGDDAGAERHLGAALALATPGVVAADVRQLLLDLFRATGRRDAFDLHAAEWAREHADAVPPWEVSGAASDVVSPAGGAENAPVVWVCPAVLDVAAVDGLAQAADGLDGLLVMDWRALASADAVSAHHLLAVFERWITQPLALALVGSATLRRSLRASTPSGRRENNPVWWRLRLAALQIMGRADEFDLAALDYCVTYGVTPPEWALPTCDLRELDGVPASAQARRPSAAAVQATSAVPCAGRLQGALHGDVTTDLNAIAGPGPGSGVVGIDCSAVTRTDFVAAGALLQWAMALKDGGRRVQLQDVHGLLAVFFHIVGVAEVAEVLPRRRV